MSYKKGKDIKVPFDCLWHYYTRKFEVIYSPSLRHRGIESNIDNTYYNYEDKPEDFNNW